MCEGEGCRSSSISGNSGGDKDFEYYHASQGQRGQNHARDGNGNENPFTRGKSICSKCCVEVGTEGKVWCLVCFEGDADENTRGGGDSGDEELENETGRVEEWLDSFTE